ncbi:MAG: hypothetical protein ACI4K7_05705 [Oscillospiraceae bacterium]
MKRRKIAGLAAALALITALSAFPAEYVSDCGFAVTASAKTAEDIWEDLPCRICGGGYGDLKVVPAGSGKLKLSWEGSKNKTYGVYINFTDSEPVIVHGTSVVLSGLTNGYIYSFFVYEMKKTSKGYEQADDMYEHYTYDSPTALKKITGLKKRVKGGTAEFVWDPVKGAEKYEIYIDHRLYKTVKKPALRITDCPGGKLGIYIVPVKSSGKYIDYGVHTFVDTTFGTGGAIKKVKYVTDEQSQSYNGKTVYEFGTVYPELTLKSSDANDIINSFIVDTAYDHGTVEKRMNRSRTDLEERYGGEEYIIKSYLYTDIKVTACTDKYISIKTDFDGYEGFNGIYHYDWAGYYNFDAVTGEEIHFSDVFDIDKFTEKCIPLIAAKIMSMPEAHYSDISELEHELVWNGLPFTDFDWYYGGGYLTVKFDRYTFHHVSGEVSVQLSYNDIKSCLTDRGKTLFTK